METEVQPARRAPTPRSPISDPSDDNGGETSLFELGSVLLRNGRRLVWAGVAGALLAVLPIVWTDRQYRATTSFAPQASDMQRQGLSALAGQLGLPLSINNPTQSPQFYSDLVKSTGILARFAEDSFVVPERGPDTVPFVTLFKIKDKTPQRRADRTVKVLNKYVGTKISLQTGVVTVTVTTPWRSLSLAMAQRLVDRVNQFDLQSRQTQASNERRFVEGRLREAKAQLAEAENTLEVFLTNNRQLAASTLNRQSGSPQLALQRERLERDVMLRQQVVMTLTQSYEEVRIREVRDTPVISIIQAPTAPERPESRGIALRVVAGGMLGAFAMTALILLSEGIGRRRRGGDTHVEQFMQQLAAVWARVTGRRGTVSR